MTEKPPDEAGAILHYFTTFAYLKRDFLPLFPHISRSSRTRS